MSSREISNKLLRALSHDDLALLGALEPIELDLRHPVEQANQTIEHVYFPDSGIISVVAKSADDQIEAGVVGREGMTGTAVVMGNHRSPNDAYVQMAGAGHRVPAQRVRDAVETSSSLRQLMQRYAQVFMVQVAQTALANGRAKIEERLARWLLMAHDRQDDDDLRLTHEFIAIMLGVRRPGVTDALHQLEAKSLIRSNRGAIRIVDRAGLLGVAGGAYGVPESEYKRLLG
jgi:CRP-like cAMP-binding protein